MLEYACPVLGVVRNSLNEAFLVCWVPTFNFLMIHKSSCLTNDCRHPVEVNGHPEARGPEGSQQVRFFLKDHRHVVS